MSCRGGDRTKDQVRCPVGGGTGQRTRSFVPVLGFSQDTGSRPSESLVVVGLPGLPWAVQGLGFRFWEAPAAKYCSGSNHFLTMPTTVCRLYTCVCFHAPMVLHVHTSTHGLHSDQSHHT